MFEKTDIDFTPDQKALLEKMLSQKADMAGAQLTTMVPKISATLDVEVSDWMKRYHSGGVELTLQFQVL